MKKELFPLVFKSLACLGVFAMLTISSCKDDVVVDPETIASYQFVIDADDILKVTFTNYSQNATSHHWDFGDGNTSTEESPVHTFALPGKYQVVLSVTGPGGATAQHTKSVTLMDPDQAMALLASTVSKTWYLQRQGVALGIGPSPGDNQWWSFGGVTPLADRPCILDDAFTFFRDGRIEFESNGTIFIDSEGNGGWLGPTAPEGCYDESEPGVLMAATGEDLSAFGNGGDYTFVFDQQANTIRVDGLGFYIGLANKLADGDNYIPQQSKTYTVANFAAGSVADSITLTLTNGSIAWNFNLVSYHNPADLPDIPSVQPKANFQFVKDGYTVTFANSSMNSTMYAWDFGDGAMSTEKDPVHKYAGEGEYMVTLTASDAMGGSDMITKTVQISAAQFSLAALSSPDGKIWKLAGEGSFYVGPTAGSAEWWPGITAADLDARACQLDDEYIFFDDGKYEYDAKGAVFAEDYMGGSFACVDEGDLTPPYDALASGVYTFEGTEATDTDPATIKVIGDGAFLGFSKAFNGGELNGTIAPVDEITYTVLEYTAAGGVETLKVVIDISAGQTGTAWWTIVLESGN